MNDDDDHFPLPPPRELFRGMLWAFAITILVIAAVLAFVELGNGY